jgi:hypothetical protein
MVGSLSDWPAAAMLIESGLQAIGLWMAAYLVLSLSLALAWIALVSLAQGCQNPRGFGSKNEPFRPLSTARSFRRWLRENGDFADRLEYFADPPSLRRGAQP